MENDFRRDLPHLPSSCVKREKFFSSLPQKRVIILAGPTASGKSKLSIELAKTLDGEIISADSIQVYCGLDIGTAKVSCAIRQQIPHHLIDICDLSMSFNVAQFYKHASIAIEEITTRGRVPIVVGGTGFYLRALLYGPPEGPPSDPKLREKIEVDADKFGLEVLYDKVCQYDPKYGAKISCRDRHKIIRALEIMTLSKKKVSSFTSLQREKVSIPEWNFRCWFAYFPKPILFPRIEMRCDEMIAQGLIAEVESLIDKGLKENSSASQAIGYRQCLKFLESSRSDRDWERFVWELKRATRAYAKRQFTWFRKEPSFRWIDLDVHGYQKTLELIIQDYESFY